MTKNSKDFLESLLYPKLAQGSLIHLFKSQKEESS